MPACRDKSRRHIAHMYYTESLQRLRLRFFFFRMRAEARADDTSRVERGRSDPPELIGRSPCSCPPWRLATEACKSRFVARAFRLKADGYSICSDGAPDQSSQKSGALEPSLGKSHCIEYF